MLALGSTTSRQASPRQPLCVDIDGFSPNAAVRVEAHDRKRLELLCRYITRPALPDKRVRSNSAKAVLKLGTGWYDGTMESLMSAADLMQRLAAPFNDRSTSYGASRESLLCDNQSSVADVGSGSTAGLREVNLDAVDLPVEPSRQTHDVRRQWASAVCSRTRPPASGRAEHQRAILERPAFEEIIKPAIVLLPPHNLTNEIEKARAVCATEGLKHFVLQVLNDRQQG
jgi:Putative transposase